MRRSQPFPTETPSQRLPRLSSVVTFTTSRTVSFQRRTRQDSTSIVSTFPTSQTWTLRHSVACLVSCETRSTSSLSPRRRMRSTCPTTLATPRPSNSYRQQCEEPVPTRLDTDPQGGSKSAKRATASSTIPTTSSWISWGSQIIGKRCATSCHHAPIHVLFDAVGQYNASLMRRVTLDLCRIFAATLPHGTIDLTPAMKLFISEGMALASQRPRCQVNMLFSIFVSLADTSSEEVAVDVDFRDAVRSLHQANKDWREPGMTLRSESFEEGLGAEIMLREWTGIAESVVRCRGSSEGVRRAQTLKCAVSKEGWT